ncbi:hypothetical protein K440DRAFT_639778 [Wilcoxina mikolae CBS 423.85]|nr:hypothetical protein K440DRAFT_639778 [Wilcoxina mikolae CBS 423.85]
MARMAGKKRSIGSTACQRETGSYTPHERTKEYPLLNMVETIRATLMEWDEAELTIRAVTSPPSAMAQILITYFAAASEVFMHPALSRGSPSCSEKGYTGCVGWTYPPAPAGAAAAAAVFFPCLIPNHTARPSNANPPITPTTIPTIVPVPIDFFVSPEEEEVDASAVLVLTMTEPGIVEVMVLTSPFAAVVSTVVATGAAVMVFVVSFAAPPVAVFASDPESGLAVADALTCGTYHRQ